MFLTLFEAVSRQSFGGKSKHKNTNTKLENMLCPNQHACPFLPLPSAHSLNSFIHHYEPLSYDVNDLMWNHHRVRRSFVGPKEINLKFHALER